MTTEPVRLATAIAALLLLAALLGGTTGAVAARCQPPAVQVIARQYPLPQAAERDTGLVLVSLVYWVDCSAIWQSCGKKSSAKQWGASSSWTGGSCAARYSW